MELIWWIIWIIGIIAYFIIGWKLVDFFLGDSKEQTETKFYLFLIISWIAIAVCLIVIALIIVIDNIFSGLAEPRIYKDSRGNLFLENAHIGNDTNVKTLFIKKRKEK